MPQQVIVLFLIILIVYFLIIRPQKKRQKEHQSMLDNLKVGDEVITNGGIVGKVAALKKEKNLISLKLSDNVKVDFLLNAISSVISKKEIKEAKLEKETKVEKEVEKIEKKDEQK